MDRVHDSVAWYQKKIGSYDKHIWEQSSEQKILRSIQLAPRRSVRQKIELIDVDLVRGSTFSRAKPQVSWTNITLKAIVKVVFFPLYYKWWLQQMPVEMFVFLMVLFVMQIISLFIFFRNVGGSIMKDEQTLSEVVIPAILMLILGQIHSQTVLSHCSHRSQHRDNKLARKSSTGLIRESKIRNTKISEVKRSFSVPSQTVGTIYENVPQNSSADLSQTPKHNRKPATDRLVSHSKVDVKKQNGSVDKAKKQTFPDKLGTIIKTGANITEHKSVSWSDAYCVKTSHIGGHESPDTDARTDEEDYPTEEKGISEKEPGSEDETENLVKCSRKNLNSPEVVGSLENGLSNEISVKKQNGLDSVEVVEKDFSIQEVVTACVDFKAKIKENSTESYNTGQYVNNGIKREIHDSTLTEEHKRVGETCGNLTSVLRPSKHGPVSNGQILTSGKSPPVPTDICLPDSADGNQILPEKNASKCRSVVNGAKILLKHSLTSFSNGSDDVFVDNTNDVLKNNLDDENASDCSPQDTESVCNSSHGSVESGSMKRFISSPIINTSRTRCETGSDSDDPRDKAISYKGLRRRKNTSLQEDCQESNTSIFRSRRPPSSLNMKTRESKGSTGISSSEGETVYTPDGSKAGASSEAEWEDRVQSDITTSTYSSSSASDNDISENDTHEVIEESTTDPSLPPSASPSVIASERTAKVTSSLHGNYPSLRARSRSCSVTSGGYRGPSEHPTSTTSVSPPPDKVSCLIWEDKECKKVELTALDIGWTIIEKVDNIPESSDYLWIGLSFSLFQGIVPLIFRLYHAKEFPDFLTTDGLLRISLLFISNSWRINLIMVNGMIQRLCLGGIFFFLLSVADRTFKQRLLYAKHFCYLTSSRRAKKFDMPHFRLNKVRNIKIWLSLRSYLKKRGPQRSVDIIVSVTFLLTIIILTLMCLQLLKDTDTYLDFLCNWELLVWCMALGVYLLRFMTLGLKINKKYRNLSVLITEQINLYLQMEQKPHKKEELMVANNVLKLAEDLLKELESPFKISGVSANPVIYNVTKVVVLSAFSAVLTELLGFKMKLYKIKLRA
ncbi:putative homeodomain transcription factor 1 isoform X2 [Mizuhopecten yessoensis]|uniref:putative homeodomain transcription factor 1 isoform X2 n=1 Tax=Mizuhopecten yessoensis TaxID=6573 RepID=UPI000B457E75|nr:putative homeodomain transcription factor 1 isoform X2 [Mizuhopecten yessoensis]